MDPMPSLEMARGQRSKGSKASHFSLSHQSNYIDAEPPPDIDICGRHREARTRRRDIETLLPHQHFVYLYIGQDQKWHARASSYFTSVRKDVLAQVLPLLKGDMVAAGAGDEFEEEPLPPFQPQALPMVEERPRQSAVSYPFNAKRRRMHSESAEPASQPAARSRGSEGISSSKQQRSSKSSKRQARNEANMIVIQPNETEKWDEWFANAFKATQQTACRSIAKEWIKNIHPKKQSTHPYNGNMPRSGYRSPERTRPPYWPHDVRHKEPDHIDKTARTKLLVHLIQNTPQQEVVPGPTPSEKLFYAKDLLTVLEQKQDEAVMPKMEIIREIAEVREKLEIFAEGGVDDSSGICVTDWGSIIGGSNSKKKKHRSNDMYKTDDDVEQNDPDEDNTPALTPNVSLSEANTLESVTMNDLASMEVTSSFCSSTPSQENDIKAEIVASNCAIRDQYQQSTGPPNSSYTYDMPYSRHGSMSVHVDQTGQPVQFIAHTGISHDPSYGHSGWSMGPPSAGVGMNSSFDDSVLSYATPVSTAMTQPPYEETMVLRLRNTHGMMQAGRLPNSQYPYPIDDSIPRNFHMPNGMQNDYQSTGMFYGR